jgi:pimeloyl-ACP methyl ester carboxylesterase
VRLLVRTSTGAQPTDAGKNLLAHGFRKVRGTLHAAGHEVFTPSLTGIGERVHLTGPQVCLTTHIADVVNMVVYEDLDGIVLLGFSHGGFVITGALEYIAGRVRRLVYLDAFGPGDGDRLDGAAGTGRGMIGLGGDWLVPAAPREPRPEPAGPFWSAADRAMASPARRYREIATSHMVASNRPADLVRLLLELA